MRNNPASFVIPRIGRRQMFSTQLFCQHAFEKWLFSKSASKNLDLGKGFYFFPAFSSTFPSILLGVWHFHSRKAFFSLLFEFIYLFLVVYLFRLVIPSPETQMRFLCVGFDEGSLGPIRSINTWHINAWRSVLWWVPRILIVLFFKPIGFEVSFSFYF